MVAFSDIVDLFSGNQIESSLINTSKKNLQYSPTANTTTSLQSSYSTQASSVYSPTTTTTVAPTYTYVLNSAGATTSTKKEISSSSVPTINPALTNTPTQEATSKQSGSTLGLSDLGEMSPLLIIGGVIIGAYFIFKKNKK